MTRQGVPARIVVALDKFKASLRADQAVDAVADGILRSAPTTSVVRTPIADGGDGSVDAVDPPEPGRPQRHTLGPEPTATRRAHPGGVGLT